MQYHYEVAGEEVDFEPIDATNIHQAARKIRKILANPNVWAHGTGPFDGVVLIRSADDQAHVKMVVTCAQASD